MSVSTFDNEVRSCAT